MTLSWNEIKDRAIRFSKEWDGEISEQAEHKVSGTSFSISSEFPDEKLPDLKGQYCGSTTVPATLTFSGKVRSW